MTKITLLDYALLGLLAQGDQAGYDLRKVFQETPLGHYSDSPGSIYPALARLEAGRLIRGTAAAAGRKRRLLALAPAGRKLLLRWLDEPVDRSLIANNRGAFALKLAFYSDHRTPAQLERFLTAAADALDALFAETAAALRVMEGHLSPSGKVALAMGADLIHAKAALLRRAALQTREKQ